MLRSFSCLLLAGAIGAAGFAQPALKPAGAATQLYVEGKPFLIRGAEVFNSTTSSLGYMEPMWTRLTACHANTVLAPVSWEQFEPTEGRYDFTLVDGLLEGARRHHLKLVLLWFGSWKNLVSSYAPRWVREDPERFPMAKNEAGHTLPTLSPLGRNTLQADTRAFVQLLRHLRQVDARQQTVIMVQVQNEMGLAGGERDHSPGAEAAFAGPVPPELLAALTAAGDALPALLRDPWIAAGRKQAGSWREVFGPTVVTTELFMSWQFARYAGQVAAAGKAEYPLPLIVNAALGRSDGKVGSYPSGGPMPWFLELWRAAAPAIDLLCPDIYAKNFGEWADRFARPGNPLFVPETFPVPANVVLALGRHRALGVSPFGFEGRVAAGDEYATFSGLIAELEPLILASQATGNITAAVVGTENKAVDVRLGAYTVSVRLRAPRRGDPAPEAGYALLVGEGPDTFVVLGRDVDVMFALPDQPPAIVALDRVEEGNYRDGRWVPGRRFNGDEIMLSYDFHNLAAERRTGTGLRFDQPNPSLQRVVVFKTR